MKKEELSYLIRETREGRSLSRSDLARIARVPVGVIRKLEDGMYDELPEPPYLSPFLERLAQVLELEEEKLLSFIDDRKYAPDISNITVGKVGELKWRVPHFFLLFFLLICTGLLYWALTWNWGLKGEGPSHLKVEKMVKQKERAVNVPSSHLEGLEELKNTPTLGGTPAIAAPEPVQEYALLIKAHDRCWVHMKLEDGTERDFILKPGERYKMSYARECVVRLGNSGAVGIEINGKKALFGGEISKPLTLQFQGENCSLLSPKGVNH